jgi:hypothetical protein
VALASLRRERDELGCALRRPRGPAVRELVGAAYRHGASVGERGRGECPCVRQTADDTRGRDRKGGVHDLTIHGLWGLGQLSRLRAYLLAPLAFLPLLEIAKKTSAPPMIPTATKARRATAGKFEAEEATSPPVVGSLA